MSNPTTVELRAALTAFAQWRHQHLTGDEKGEAQTFLDRLFRAFGHGGIQEAGATLEARIKSEDRRGTAFADLMWKPRVLIEMKREGADLRRHYRQAFDYWVRAVPDRPRYVVLCNFDEFWVYDFDKQLDEPVDRVALDDLAQRWESFAFLLPEERPAVFQNDLVAVTREAAGDVAQVLNSLLARDVDRKQAQRFVLQCVMAMFAEDVGLLPAHFYTQALDDARTGADAYDLLGQLFTQMNTRGTTPGGRFRGTPYFNGGLFATVNPIELNMTELRLLRDAAKTDWGDVRPEIFGTIFETSMGKDERHATGAHYTSQTDIAMIVRPVIVEPWRARIDAANSRAAINELLTDMQKFRVLDPACGSGNFLYVAYREMRRLEYEAVEKYRSMGRGGDLPDNLAALAHVQPDHFLGLDINEFAVEIAKVTLLLAKKLAADELQDEDDSAVLPLDNLDSSIRATDALFTPWPKADAIIGNPPYIGRRSMVDELGAVYCARLAERYPNVNGVSDFVCYWFPLAHDALPEGGRAGLVATKTIKQGYSRRASLDYVVDHGGAIIEAVSHKPWSGEANVTVSIVNWQKGGLLPSKRVLWVDNGEERLELDVITTSLAPSFDVKNAHALKGGPKIVFQGQTPGIIDAFRVSSVTAGRLVRESPASRNVLRPLLGGDELLKQLSTDEWLIDVPDRNIDVVRETYPGIYARLAEKALPPRRAAATKEADRNRDVRADNPRARLNTHHAKFLDRWWQLAYRREEMLAALDGLDRYVALTRTSSELRGPVFAFVDGAFTMSDTAVTFPFSDDYSFGVLQSSVHVTWFRERCTTLETRLTYTSGTVSDTFPWPQDPAPDAVERVAAAAAAINDFRAEAFRMGRTLAHMYDALRDPGRSALRTLHEELDAAVLAAYGFDDADLLPQIFALNMVVAGHLKAGDRVTWPGPQPGAHSRSTWRFPAPALP